MTLDLGGRLFLRAQTPTAEALFIALGVARDLCAVEVYYQPFGQTWVRTPLTPLPGAAGWSEACLAVPQDTLSIQLDFRDAEGRGIEGLRCTYVPAEQSFQPPWNVPFTWEGDAPAQVVCPSFPAMSAAAPGPSEAPVSPAIAAGLEDEAAVRLEDPSAVTLAMREEMELSASDQLVAQAEGGREYVVAAVQAYLGAVLAGNVAAAPSRAWCLPAAVVASLATWRHLRAVVGAIRRNPVAGLALAFGPVAAIVYVIHELVIHGRFLGDPGSGFFLYRLQFTHGTFIEAALLASALRALVLLLAPLGRLLIGRARAGDAVDREDFLFTGRGLEDLRRALVVLIRSYAGALLFSVLVLSRHWTVATAGALFFGLAPWRRFLEGVRAFLQYPPAIGAMIMLFAVSVAGGGLGGGSQYFRDLIRVPALALSFGVHRPYLFAGVNALAFRTLVMAVLTMRRRLATGGDF